MLPFGVIYKIADTISVIDKNPNMKKYDTNYT